MPRSRSEERLTLNGIAGLSSKALREAWTAQTGKPLPRVSPTLLRLALAWELQAMTHGGLPAALRRQLDQLAAGRTRTRRAGPGMRLSRAWNGTLHVVTIDEAGAIQWQGRTWRSLSEVARAITGTRWSGPAFFGLKQKVAA